MDSDLAESVSALKSVFEKRYIPANFGKSEDATVNRLKTRLGLPDRYASFLKEADPLDVETATPSERIRFVPAAELEKEQNGYGRGDDETPPMAGWREGWIVIAHSSLLGDPYFLDTTKGDAEGDCPVMTAMTGANLNPVVCASTFACFMRILATAMEVAEDFSDQCDHDEEHIFREALVSKIRVVDKVAVREGHWTRGF